MTAAAPYIKNGKICRIKLLLSRHSPPAFRATLLLLFRQLFHQLYRHPQVNRRRKKTTQIIRDLFELYNARPNLLLGEAGMAEAMDNPVARAGVVTDTIASMTDKAAIEEHRRQFDLYSVD